MRHNTRDNRPAPWHGATLDARWICVVLAKLKAAWSRLVSAGASGGPEIPAVEYKGYRICPEPYRTKDQYQTAGRIEKITAEGMREHRFVRADTYRSHDEAIAFTITKAKQIIDQQGDRMFT